MHFFTADQHYGHSNIIRFCSRPFAPVSFEQMKTIMAERPENPDLIQKR